MNEENVSPLSKEDGELVSNAMAVDSEIVRLKGELNRKMQARSDLLEKLHRRQFKRFPFKGEVLSIYRKNGGLWALRGKKSEPAGGSRSDQT